MSRRDSIPRRSILKAAAAGGAAALFGGGTLAAQQGAPAIATNTQAGRKYRAYVKFGKELPAVVELKARALTARQGLIRTQAAQTCYTNVDQCLIPGVAVPTSGPTIVGHGGVGVVEAIGPQVTRARVGDRVVVTLHRACGSCFNCLRMRSDKCLNGGAQNAIPTSDMADGTAIFSPTGAMAELTITNEEYAVPVFTDLPAADLAMLTCVGGCGLGMAMTNVPVEVASDVVIFRAGPVGLSAVQAGTPK